MKNKGFRWLLGVLAESAIKIRVLNTYSLQSFLASDYFYNEENVLKHRKITYIMSNKEVIEAISNDINLLSKNSKQPIAIGYSRNEKIQFTDIALKEYLQNPHHNFTYIQKITTTCRESFEFYSSIITLRDYSYEMSVLRKDDEISVKVKNKIFIQRLKDIMQSVLYIVEQASSCKVKKLQLEFIKDDFDNFWLSFCHSCIVAKDLKVLNEVKTHRELRIKEGLIKKNYHFRIETPENSDTSQISDQEFKDQITMKKYVPGKNSDRASPDFLELICRTRVKYRTKNNLKLPSLMFYAEPEELNKEKEFIYRMIESPSLSLKFPRVDKVRKSLWTKPIEARHFGLDINPRQSSPMLFPLTGLDNCKTPTPKIPSLFKDF